MLPIITDFWQCVIIVSIYIVSAIVLLFLIFGDESRLKRIYKKEKRQYTYIFDLDGTLIDSSLDIIGSLARAYSECGFKEVRIDPAIIGYKILEIVNILTPKISDSNKTRVCACFRHIYDNCGYYGTRLYPGVKDVLKRYNGRCYLVTNKPHKATFDLLKKFKLRFEAVFTGTEGKTKSQMLKEMIKAYGLKDVVYVGDTPADKKAANEAGCMSALVTYGYGDPYLAHGCNWLLADIRELYDRE
jgi:phosphoglycolate phosphatase